MQNWNSALPSGMSESLLKKDGGSLLQNRYSRRYSTYYLEVLAN